ncbi:hypothetical protein A7A08_01188 [Methyloligella halotolerans]|uniref:Uncharacterized protein n=1 Tax=Methyloligella halotolerans TaxID=1177755 RepID=A0A1E2S102_9HYPH|nr:hypothetical protein [Methyloligella halotolerans]ODA68018.1 hypothetical protein A7A08_01188 [Methyloligella halotolerans]
MLSLYRLGALYPPPVVSKMSSLRTCCPTRPGIGEISTAAIIALVDSPLAEVP